MKIAMPGRRPVLAAAAAAVAVLALAGARYPALPSGHHRVPETRMVTLTPQHVSRQVMNHGLEEVLVQASASLGTGLEGALQAACPAGYTASGGGASIGTTAASGLPRGISNAYLTADQAVPNATQAPNAWLAIATNVSGSAAPLTVQALCIRLHMGMGMGM